MIIIDYKDTRPIYEQIVDKFQNLILKGVLEPDSKMPSVRSLAVELSVNPNTIQKAYMELERRNFIYTIIGRGNFVTYNNNLSGVKKAELREKIDAVLKEAHDFNIETDEIISYIRKEGGLSD